PRPQDVRPAATLRARPRRVPPRTSLHRAPQSSAAQSLSISRAHAREPRPSEPSTVVLPSSPASSRVPTTDVARSSALLLIRHSSVSKQRPASRRTIKIRPQPLCAGSGFSGPPGRGKTHLAVAVAYLAIQNGFEARFSTADELIGELSAAAAQGQLEAALEPYVHPHVLVIDELGYQSYAADAANVLYRVVNERYLKKRPIIVTPNKHLAALGHLLLH